MKTDLAKELRERGTAEISDGVVNQVTQAIDEKPDKVKFIIFGELREKSIIPIDEACAKCGYCHFPTVEQCQALQAKSAKARGFNQVICPNQLVD